MVAPISLPRRAPKPPWVREEIVRLTALIPDAGCRTLAHHIFNRQFAAARQTTVGKTFVHEVIRQHGRIERFFGTLKQKLDQGQVDCCEELVAALPLFRFWYNQVRPHDYLDGRTPVEVWRGIDPFVQPARDQQEFQAWEGLLTGYHQLR